MKTNQLGFPPVFDLTTEWMKFNMAAAAVLLGLTLSIFAAPGHRKLAGPELSCAFMTLFTSLSISSDDC